MHPERLQWSANGYYTDTLHQNPSLYIALYLDVDAHGKVFIMRRKTSEAPAEHYTAQMSLKDLERISDILREPHQQQYINHPDTTILYSGHHYSLDYHRAGGEKQHIDYIRPNLPKDLLALHHLLDSMINLPNLEAAPGQDLAAYEKLLEDRLAGTMEATPPKAKHVKFPALIHK